MAILVKPIKEKILIAKMAETIKEVLDKDDFIDLWNYLYPENELNEKDVLWNQ